MLTLLLMLSGTDVMQSSAQILYNTSYYPSNINQSLILTNSMTYASIVSIFVIIFGGVLYDIFGRVTTVSLMFAVGALATLMPPYVAPSIPLYICAKIIFNSSMVPIVVNPFINDYVKV